MNSPLTLLILFLNTGFASLSAALITPALPEVMSFFHVSEQSVEGLITIFLLGYMIGQWMYGPITQRIGRKPTLLIGFSIALLGNAVCLFAAQLEMFSLLLLGRFIQALGSSVGLIVSLAMVHDCFEGNQARHKTAIITLAFALLPGIAVLIGGLLLAYFPWQSHYVFFIIYTLLLTFLVKYLPETSQSKDKDALKLKNMIGRYKKVLANIHIFRYGSMWGLCTCFIYIISALLPILTNQLGISPTTFSLAFLSTSLALFIGNLLSAKWVEKYSGLACIQIGLGIIVLGASLFVACFTFNILTITTLFGSLFLIYLGMPLVFCNASAIAATYADDKPTVSSYVALMNLGVAFIGSLAVECIALPTTVLLPAAAVIIFLLLTGQIVTASLHQKSLLN